MQLLPEAMSEKVQQHAAPCIKQEKVDDREIDQLALEMAEKNRQKMITQAAQIRQQNQVSQQALQRAGGQQMITYYFNRDKTSNAEDSLLPRKAKEERTGIVDEDSKKGRFGWFSVGLVHIPYMFRNDDSNIELYCSVRMVELKLLNRYLNYLPQEINTCIHVRSYYITEDEARLLNEINSKHCDYSYGREAFTVKDLVVRVHDAKCFHKFLDTCFKKLVTKSPEQSDFCGFVRINGESVVPYTVKGNIKFVPLFYFEGETETLKLKAEKIDGWELAYLKFCCKVQGIRNELFASDICAVVSLEDVKQYFPKDTLFEDWWPQKTAEPMRVVSHMPKCREWVQKPPGQPPIPTQVPTPQVSLPLSVPSSTPMSASSRMLPNPTHTMSVSSISSTMSSLPSLTNSLSSLNSMSNITSLYNHWAATMMNGQAAQAQAVAAAYSNHPGMQGLFSGLTPDHMRRLGLPTAALGAGAPLLPNIAPVSSQGTIRPPPLVRSSNSGSSHTSTSSSRLQNSALDATLHQLGYSGLPDSSAMGSLLTNLRTHPPNVSPLGTAAANASMHSVIKSSKSALAPAPPPLIPVTNGLRTDNLSSHKGVGRNGLDKQKLVDVPPFRPDPSRIELPYKVRKINIDGKPILCINHTAYHFSDVGMVAIQDIIKEFFPSATLAECTEVFQTVLGVTAYKANWHQVYALMEAWGSDTTPEFVPLIVASDVVKYLSQIKYIFQRHRPSQPQSKRGLHHHQHVSWKDHITSL